MRFISKSRNYSVTLDHGVVEYIAEPRGHSFPVQKVPVLSANFEVAVHSPLGLEPWEVEAAFARWPNELDARMSGDPEEEGSRRTPIEHVLGVFDSLDPRRAWSSDTIASVEEGMLANPSCGVDFIPVLSPTIEAPWPNYSKITGKNAPRMIAEKVLESGYDPRSVIAYEKRYGNRADVLAELEKLPAPDPSDEAVAA